MDPLTPSSEDSRMAQSPNKSTFFNTPPSTPSKPRYGDRFIPTRTGNTWRNFGDSTTTTCPSTPTKVVSEFEQDDRQGQGNTTPRSIKRMRMDSDSIPRTPSKYSYSSFVQNEIFGSPLQVSPAQSKAPITPSLENVRTSTARRNLFHFDTTERQMETKSPFSVTPVSQLNQELLKSWPRTPKRVVDPIAYKVLDAPGIQENFYLNLLAWSKKNILGVGLGPQVYLSDQSAPRIPQVHRLIELETDETASIAFNELGSLIAVGWQNTGFHIFDPVTKKRVWHYQNPPERSGRIGSLAWNGANVIFSGGKTGIIVQSDIRDRPNNWTELHEAHRAEVCGLKWSADNVSLASGGNDNLVCVWDVRRPNPIYQFRGHCAAVKALDWCPHQHGLLASGGGSNDKTIRFWNCLTGSVVNDVVTDSQVCNLAWSHHSMEFLSTSGFSKKSDLTVWKYPELHKIAELKGHQSRVLYMAMSPDGCSVVTGSGDETLRFWNIFKKVGPPTPRTPDSVLSLHGRLGCSFSSVRRRL